MLGLIILAAGRGSRLKSKIPKCMNKLAGKPMIDYVLENYSSLDARQKILVIGYKKEIIINYLGNRVDYAVQNNLLGTAHATKRGLKKINKNINHILVSNSDDACFYKPATLKRFLKNHISNNYNFSFLTVKLKDLPSVGSVIKRNPLRLEPACKEKSYEVVCGAYLFKRAWLENNLKKVKKNKVSGEYYLTDLIRMAVDDNNKKTYAFSIPSSQWIGINTLLELKRAQKAIGG